MPCITAIDHKAVANFIGLAAGQRPWLDLPTGLARTNPFYSGLTFHRVITNFVIQAGSPNGLGNDGPGYAFVDEITNTLQFGGFGVLAMANSGPDSNGSQFFVTAAPQPSLNGGYTIFGGLYGGSNVVAAINLVPTDANSKPLTNVYINMINIRRIGTAANAFDINAQGLPLVTNLNLAIALAGTNASLAFSNRLYADNRLYGSSNLVNWTAGLLGIETALPVSNTNMQNLLAPAQFFRAAQDSVCQQHFCVQICVRQNSHHVLHQRNHRDQRGLVRQFWRRNLCGHRLHARHFDNIFLESTTLQRIYPADLLLGIGASPVRT